jgi:hypothetical protein
MRTNYVTIDQKNFLNPFNYEHAANPVQMTDNSLNVFKEICDVDSYLKALIRSGIDVQAMPFSNLDRKDLTNALEVL